jgi:MoaA/NifB/PqqE/SkfB family radical SAM enzyme
MIFYKKNSDSDPYRELWSRPEWLNPLEHAKSIRFPLIVTVEPTNACQNECLYCSRQLMNRKTGFMELDVMERVAEECAEHAAAIRHGGFGEPLLHPKIVDLCAASRKRGVLTTIFTNGNLLTEEMMDAFIDMELDEIRFSSSGISAQEHNRIRRNSDYHADFKSKLEMAANMRKRKKANRPFLTLYTNVIDYEDDSFKNNIETYKREYLQFADKVDIDLTMFSRVKKLEHVRELYEKQTVSEVHKKCVTLFLKLIVHWNGDVFACDRAYDFEPEYHLGTLGENGFAIEKGFHSETMWKLRDAVSFDMLHNERPLCSDCFSNTTKWAKNA